MQITSEQIRAARSMLRLTLEDLAQASGVSLATIQRMEKVGGINNTLSKNVQAVQRALEAAGIVFFEAEDGSKGIRQNTSNQHI